MFKDVDENDLQDETPVDTEGDEGAEPSAKPSRTWIGVAALVLFVGAAGAFMYHRAGPAKAEANDAAQQTISTFLGSGQKSITSMKEMLEKTARTVDQFTPSSGEPKEALPKNPFYKPVAQTVVTTAPTPAAQDARLLARNRASELKLQSILVSGKRQGCMIDNKYLEVGGEVDGFTVERISAAGVVVREGAYRFELKVQR